MPIEDGNGNGSLRVTIRDVWYAQQDQAGQLARLSASVAEINAKIENWRSDDVEKIRDHEARLRVMESAEYVTRSDHDKELEARSRRTFAVLGLMVALAAVIVPLLALGF